MHVCVYFLYQARFSGFVVFAFFLCVAMVAKAPPLRVHTSSATKCVACNKGKLFLASQKVVRATVVGSETLRNVETRRLQCASRKCRAVVRCNFIWLDGRKINCMTFNEMLRAGVYFVSNDIGFDMNYLELTYYRLLRGKLAPGQEADVLHLFHQGSTDLQGRVSLRDNLLHALEGWAVARRTPTEVVKFDVNFPADQIQGGRRDALLFPPVSTVTALSFDGLFGVNRQLEPKVDPPRTKRHKGRPKKAYKEHERTRSCVKKDFTHVAFSNRTGGWQFVVDPDSKRCLGAYEHIENENMEDKSHVVEAVMAMPDVDPDLVMHDDVCHFEPYVKKRRPEKYAGVKYWIVDALHKSNHKCKKRHWTRSRSSKM
jgi:hypothetical protein